MKKILILGSTGSIGTQTLDVIRSHKNTLQVVGLFAGGNTSLLMEQIAEFNPKAVGLRDGADITKISVGATTKTYFAEEGMLQMIATLDYDIIVVAIPGAAGLKPALAAVDAGKQIALATKEVMVLAGEIFNKKVDDKNKELAKKGKEPITILPIDSEHSAIWQSLRSGSIKEIEKIVLTCSGGPFRNKKRSELIGVTPAQALNHPKWKMGNKITIDSATLMNKGLEVIEAKWLFGVEANQIEVVIHPQSILHSAVSFRDGSTIGQLGMPDMRVPIQYALSYPERPKNTFPRLSFTDVSPLTFEKPDMQTFKCLQLAYVALEKGGTAPTVLNAADEIAVAFFLQGRIRFFDIPNIIEKTIQAHKLIKQPSLHEIFNTDIWTRSFATEYALSISSRTIL